MAVRRAPVDAAAAPAWSLLLPAHWVPPVWHALIFAGAHPAGLRECAARSSSTTRVCDREHCQGQADAARGIECRNGLKWFMGMRVTCRMT